jgi:putative membrane protein
MMGGDWVPGFGWIFMVLFWALIVLGVVVLARWLFWAAGSASDGGRRPLVILKERYARGEISREQYEQMRGDLES